MTEDNYDDDPQPDRRQVLPDPDEALGLDRAPTATFPELGATISGTVVGKLTAQQTDMDTGKPLTYDDGHPRLQVIVTLQTSLNDGDIVDDDGRRRLFVKGDMTRAVRDAVKATGRRKLDLGGELSVTWADEGVAPRKGLNKPKLYEAKYLAPEEPF